MVSVQAMVTCISLLITMETTVVHCSWYWPDGWPSINTAVKFNLIELIKNFSVLDLTVSTFEKTKCAVRLYASALHCKVDLINSLKGLGANDTIRTCCIYLQLKACIRSWNDKFGCPQYIEHMENVALQYHKTTHTRCINWDALPVYFFCFFVNHFIWIFVWFLSTGIWIFFFWLLIKKLLC